MSLYKSGANQLVKRQDGVCQVQMKCRRMDKMNGSRSVCTCIR